MTLTMAEVENSTRWLLVDDRHQRLRCAQKGLWSLMHAGKSCFSTELPPSQMLHILAEISLLIVLLSFFPISILSKCLIEAMRTYIMTFSWNNRKIWENRSGRKKSQVGLSFSVASSHSNIWEHPIDDMLLCNSFKGCFLLPFHHHHHHHHHCVGRGPVHVWSEDHPWRWFFPLACSGNQTQVIKLA